MTYTKSINKLNPSACEWHAWLNIHAVSKLEYQLSYTPDHVSVEFFDQDRADEFALEFGL
jgi:hypothetical protein